MDRRQGGTNIQILLTHFHMDNMAGDILRCIFDKISLKFVPKGLINDNPALVSDNGLAPNRRQAIIWINADSMHWHIYAAQGRDGLKWALKHILFTDLCKNYFDITIQWNIWKPPYTQCKTRCNKYSWKRSLILRYLAKTIHLKFGFGMV